MIATILMIAFIILPLFTILSFELARVFLGQQELKNATDAAALTAVATLASQDNTDPTTAHNNAIAAALAVFEANSVLGVQLTNTTLESSPGGVNPPAGEATIYFQFLNANTLQPLPISSPDAKIVRCYGNFGSRLGFSNYMSRLGIDHFNITAQSEGEVPMLDIVLCYDVSGSMDDQTPVTLVQRQWDSSSNQISYTIPNNTSGPAQGWIYNVVLPDKTGATTNALSPQHLGWSYWHGQCYFSEFLGALNGVPGLRSLGGYSPSTQELGQPPNNTPPSGNGVPLPQDNEFTDLVVNLDNNMQFAGLPASATGGYPFPNVATLVEAARGNLENPTAFANSKANVYLSKLKPAIVPKAGYQAEYLKLAAGLTQPINAAKAAALTFTDIINTDTNAHFGFVSFADSIGSVSSPFDTSFYNIDINNGFLPPSYKGYGVQTNYPLPFVQIDSTPAVTNYVAVNNGINQCVALGGTNIGAGLDAAVKMLQANSRKGAVKAIVLFTDGEPSQPSNVDPKQYARNSALGAKTAGIPVYTIGLAQNPAIQPDEIAILNDTNSDPTSGGIAAIAGHGGTFTLVTDSSQLRAAFEKIARHLVQLVAVGQTSAD
jgi:von Willebrand factor type A domain